MEQETPDFEMRLDGRDMIISFADKALEMALLPILGPRLRHWVGCPITEETILAIRNQVTEFLKTMVACGDLVWNGWLCRWELEV
jgi:hypothetical protein